MRLLPIFIFLLALFPTPAVPQTTADLQFTEAPAGRAGWLYFDAPLWDLADEGLPFRLTLALPSRRDLLTRILLADEARWTFSAGYAKVYSSYDNATGVFKSPGGHAALVSAGRQMRWHLPEVLGAFAPQIAMEVGINAASHRFPADGTHLNFKLITGLEWTWRNRAETAEWSLGVMWPHFSNANFLPRNAGYDGLVIRIGRSVQF